VFLVLFFSCGVHQSGRVAFLMARRFEGLGAAFYPGNDLIKGPGRRHGGLQKGFALHPNQSIAPQKSHRCLFIERPQKPTQRQRGIKLRCCPSQMSKVLMWLIITVFSALRTINLFFGPSRSAVLKFEHTEKVWDGPRTWETNGMQPFFER